MMAPTNTYKTAAAKPKGGEDLLVTPPKQAKRRMQVIDANKDEDNIREEQLMMDLVGMGGDTGGNQQSSSAFDELDFTKTTPDDLLTQVVEQTLRAYSCDEKLTPFTILERVNDKEKQRLIDNMISPLLKNCPPQLWSSTIIDLGNYPMNPWLNNEIQFTSQMDEIEQGAIFLEGLYELKQKGDGTTIKVFHSSFEPPEDSDLVHVVRFTDCSTQLDLHHFEFEQTDFLVFNQITADDMIGFVDLINQRIHDDRQRLVR